MSHHFTCITQSDPKEETKGPQGVNKFASQMEEKEGAPGTSTSVGTHLRDCQHCAVHLVAPK
jgi:hypothetical protein